MAINKSKTMIFEFKNFEISGSGAGIISYTNLKEDILTFAEEGKYLEGEYEDMSEKRTLVARKVSGEFAVSELSQSDIIAISAGDYFKCWTTEGGANGTGMYFEVSGAEDITATFGDYKTKVSFLNSTGSAVALPYAIGDNA